MPSRLEQNAQYLTSISRMTDVATLHSMLANESADELSRIAAFYRLVELNQMDAETALRFSPKSDRLRLVQLQYAASQKKATAGKEVATRGPVRTGGAVRTRGAVRAPGADPKPAGADWREERSEERRVEKECRSRG